VISESQAEFLLSQCETWFGTKLNKLRWRLRSEHEQTESHLWELIVLHATASAVISRHHKQDRSTLETSSLIEHEGEQEAVPDIKLKPAGYDPFWVEVAYITPRNQQQETDLVRFPSWVRKELSKIKVADARPLRIRLEPADSSKDVQVPPNNSWKQLLKTDKWKTFVAGLLSGKMQSILCLEESEKANVIVRIEGVEQGDFVSSSFPTPNVPKCAEDHPIYQTIKKKAEQARDWAESGKKYKPLVLFIGASESLHQINDGGTPSSISPKQAVYSALADTEQWDLTTTLNAIGTAPWPGTKARRQRVPGSRLISAVVIVTIKNEYSDLQYGWRKRASKPLVIKNPHPDVELTAKQEQFLNQINLNQVEYGSGRESWEAQQPQDISVALYRYKERRVRFVFSCRSDFSFDIEIPCNLVARFLAGDITAFEVWNDKSSGNDDYPTLKKQIGDYLWLAGELNRKIVNVKFVQVDPKSRDESRISLEFGAITTPKKLIHDSPRAYIETDINGAFTLKLPQNLVTCLLAGKITAGEAWKSENNQKIGNFLKDAVSRGQEIIDAKFVQVGSEAESEPSLILKFGAAIDTTIREDKKIIQEEKQRRKQLKKIRKE
jgi:hypothetical protein